MTSKNEEYKEKTREEMQEYVDAIGEKGEMSVKTAQFIVDQGGFVIDNHDLMVELMNDEVTIHVMREFCEHGLGTLLKIVDPEELMGMVQSILSAGIFIALREKNND